MTLQWNIHWPTTAMALLLLPLLLSLGHWQLQRADEKRAAQIGFEAGRDAPPRDIAQLPQQPSQYARVHLRGHYDNTHSFLLDNRVVRDRFGYEILTVFLPANSSSAVLINRGWIEGDPARTQRPVIAAVEGEVDIIGSVYRDTARFHFFDNSHEPTWPKLIQNLQLDDLQQQFGASLLPFTVRLDAGMPGAYHIEWQIYASGFGPERHVAYAVTWFAMALTLIVVWLLSNSNLNQWFNRKAT